MVNEGQSKSSKRHQEPEMDDFKKTAKKKEKIVNFEKKVIQVP